MSDVGYNLLMAVPNAGARDGASYLWLGRVGSERERDEVLCEPTSHFGVPFPVNAWVVARDDDADGRVAQIAEPWMTGCGRWRIATEASMADRVIEHPGQRWHIAKFMQQIAAVHRDSWWSSRAAEKTSLLYAHGIGALDHARCVGWMRVELESAPKCADARIVSLIQRVLSMRAGDHARFLAECHAADIISASNSHTILSWEKTLNEVSLSAAKAFAAMMGLAEVDARESYHSFARCVECALSMRVYERDDPPAQGAEGQVEQIQNVMAHLTYEQSKRTTSLVRVPEILWGVARAAMRPVELEERP